MVCTLKISLGYSFADAKKRKQVDRESSLVLYQRATDRVEKRECRGRPALCRGAGCPRATSSSAAAGGAPVKQSLTEY
jgi:hypothetical protein